jgi:cell division protein FtsB
MADNDKLKDEIKKLAKALDALAADVMKSVRNITRTSRS